MRLKAESTITSEKSRANNLIVLIEFLLKFTSNDGFQLFLDAELNFAPDKLKIARIELSFKIIVVCLRASVVSIISTFLESQETENVLRLYFSRNLFNDPNESKFSSKPKPFSENEKNLAISLTTSAATAH